VVTVMRGQTRVDKATPPALRDAAETPTYSVVVSAHNESVMSEPGTRLPLAMGSRDASVDTILVDDRTSNPTQGFDSRGRQAGSSPRRPQAVAQPRPAGRAEGGVDRAGGDAVIVLDAGLQDRGLGSRLGRATVPPRDSGAGGASEEACGSRARRAGAPSGSGVPRQVT
jgi:hypothetical protein